MCVSAGRLGSAGPGRRRRYALRVVTAVVVGVFSAAAGGATAAAASSPRITGTIHDPGSFLAAALLACVGAPVVEELFFRGLVQGTLRRRLRAGWSIVVTGVTFALFHEIDGATGLMAVAQFVALVPGGLALCWLREREKNLSVSLLTHATFNLTGMVLVALAAVSAAH